MISSKKLYHEYLKADKLALGITEGGFVSKIRALLIPNLIWKFQKTLRKTEYYKNCKRGLIDNFFYVLTKYKLRKLSVKLGFSIPENVFGPGLAIVHYGTIVVNGNAKVGANCRIHACTNIGASGGSSQAPQIGDNVYIGPGAKIYGNIEVANNIAIGANAVVNKTFNEDNIMIAGNPAKKIKEIDITRIIKHV